MSLMERVLFLCTGNSCRSQMAEGWARHLRSEDIEPFSAGTKPHGMDPRAVEVMKEVGVDLSGHRSKHLDEIDVAGLDLVVTVCSNAAENCPVPPAGVRVVHAPFDDPPKLALEMEDPSDVMAAYRRVRDEIREFVAGM